MKRFILVLAALSFIGCEPSAEPAEDVTCWGACTVLNSGQGHPVLMFAADGGTVSAAYCRTDCADPNLDGYQVTRVRHAGAQ